jgi:hypothetical protein
MACKNTRTGLELKCASELIEVFPESLLMGLDECALHVDAVVVAVAGGNSQMGRTSARYIDVRA